MTSYSQSVAPKPVIEIFRARRVISLAPGFARRPTEDALAIFAGCVLAVGSAAELQERFPDAPLTDLGEGTLVPGFNDAHIHPSITAEDLLHLDVSTGAVKSLAELTRVVMDRAVATPPGSWIRASRYDDARMPEGRVLTRWDLDEVAPDHPVLIVHVAGHWGVVNSKALELGGLNESSEEPVGGAFGRDGAGRLNGVLFERALFDFAYPALSSGPSIVPESTFEDRLIGLQRAQQMFHAAGLTSLGDALVGSRDLELFQESERRRQLTARINALISYDFFSAMDRLKLQSGFGSDRLRIGGVKAFVDGAIGGRTCLLEEPFEGTDDHGMQTTSTEDLRALVRAVHNGGSRLAVHANGDRAISLLLDLIEEADAALPRPDAHHRIEHCSVITPEILERMRRLGMIAVPFATYVEYHGARLATWYGAARTERMFAHRSFLDAGVSVAAASDYPCGPFEPLLGMQACVMRRSTDGADVGPSQRITPLEALSLYTQGSAYASGEQHVKGTLAPGYLADFVVLGADPLTAPHDEIAAIPVLATYVGGQRVWPSA